MNISFDYTKNESIILSHRGVTMEVVPVSTGFKVLIQGGDDGIEIEKVPCSYVDAKYFLQAKYKGGFDRT